MLTPYRIDTQIWVVIFRSSHNKDVRAEGFKVLLEIYKHFDEKATVKTIKKNRKYAHKLC